MKDLSLTLCLVIVALFGSVGGGFALSKCPSDPNAFWHNCFGTYTYEGGKTIANGVNSEDISTNEVKV